MKDILDYPGWKAKIYHKCTGCDYSDSMACKSNCPNFNEFMIRYRKSTGIPSN